MQFAEPHQQQEPPVDPDSIAEDPSDLPPRLSSPFAGMNCAAVRAALSKLLWFHNRDMPPCYGSPNSRPSWWPDNLMPWVHLKNLRHKYEGPLGNSYTFCLRKAVKLGYDFYGLDAEKPVVLSLGGSLGAKAMNDAWEAKVEELLEAGRFGRAK